MALSRSRTAAGPRRVKLGTGATAAALSMACLLSSCAGTRVVGSKALGFFLEVPPGWAVYNQAQLQRQGLLLGATAPTFIAVFSDDPHPSAQQLNSASTYPWGVVEVESLPYPEALNLSLEGLNSQLFNVDQMAQDGETVQSLSPPQMVSNGVLRGVKASFSVPTGSKQEDYQITSWVNSATSRLWIFAVGCSPECFQADHSTIDRVMGTFTVQNRGT